MSHEKCRFNPFFGGAVEYARRRYEANFFGNPGRRPFPSGSIGSRSPDALPGDGPNRHTTECARCAEWLRCWPVEERSARYCFGKQSGSPASLVGLCCGLQQWATHRLGVPRIRRLFLARRSNIIRTFEVTGILRRVCRAWLRSVLSFILAIIITALAPWTS